MKKAFKSFVALSLCFIMIFGSAPLDWMKDLDINFPTLNLDLSSLFEPFAEKVSAAETTYTSEDKVFTYSLNSNNEATITGYSGNDDELVIDKIDGYNVIAIGASAFNNAKFNSIILPETITTIGNSAFVDCANLSSINLDSVVTIGKAGTELSKDGKVKCNSGFFKKIVAFFKGLFNKLPTVIIKP